MTGVTEVLATWEAGLAADELRPGPAAAPRWPARRPTRGRPARRPSASATRICSRCAGRCSAQRMQVRLGLRRVRRGHGGSSSTSGRRRLGRPAAQAVEPSCGLSTGGRWCCDFRPPTICRRSPARRPERRTPARRARAEPGLAAACWRSPRRRAGRRRRAAGGRAAPAGGQPVAEADPYADVTARRGLSRLRRAPPRPSSTSPPSCGPRLDAWARATLLDVHLLATAYGWSEPEVLALSALRRRYYLELSGHV